MTKSEFIETLKKALAKMTTNMDEEMHGNVCKLVQGVVLLMLNEVEHTVVDRIEKKIDKIHFVGDFIGYSYTGLNEIMQILTGNDNWGIDATEFARSCGAIDDNEIMVITENEEKGGIDIEVGRGIEIPEEISDSLMEMIASMKATPPAKA